MTTKLLAPMLAALIPIAAFASCREAAAPAPATPQQAAVPPVAGADAPIDASVTALLDLAWNAASALPADPHLKTRCQLQQDVVDALLSQGQRSRAVACAEEIGNWRRGVCFARIAQQDARTGHAEAAAQLLARARQVLADPDVQKEQDWRREAIRSAIAAAQVALGQHEAAAATAVRMADPETGRLEAMPIEPVGAAAIEAHFRRVDEAIRAADLDAMNADLTICARLFDREYADTALRDACEGRIRAARTKLPVPMGLDLLFRMVVSAAGHGDAAKAGALALEAETVVRAARWQPEDETKARARVARAFALAGDAERARSEAQIALGVYEQAKPPIVDIWRAGALRAVAEACMAIGDVEDAHRAFSRALDEGMVNPNGRPRTQDLVGTVLSMVASRYQPDAAQHERIAQIVRGMGAPW